MANQRIGPGIPTSRTLLASTTGIAIAIAGALSLALAMGVGRFAFTPVLPLMLEGGQLDIAAAGWIAAANYAGYLVGAMTAARMRWSPRALSVVALVATVVLTSAMAVAMPSWAWAVTRFAAGVASAWAFVGTAVWCLGRLAALQQGGRATIVYAGVGCGIAITGLACLAGAAVHLSAAAMWLWLAALGAAMLLPVFLVLRRTRGPVEPTTPVRPAAAPTRAAEAGQSGTPMGTTAGAAHAAQLASRSAAATPSGTTGLIACYGALGFGYILPATFLPVLARDVIADPRVFGLAWPVFGATAAVSTLLAGWAMRRAGRIRVWAMAHIAMGIGVLLPSIRLSATTVALSALLVGGTFMIVTMAGVQEMRERAAGDATRLVGRMTAAFAWGQIAGPIASSLFLHVPALHDRGLALALQVAAASLIASAVWLWRIAPPNCKETVHVREDVRSA